MPKRVKTAAHGLAHAKRHQVADDDYDVLGFLPGPSSDAGSGVMEVTNSETASEHTKRVVTEWQAHENFGAELHVNDVPPIPPDDISLSLLDDISPDGYETSTNAPTERNTLAVTRDILTEALRPADEAGSMPTMESVNSRTINNSTIENSTIENSTTRNDAIIDHYDDTPDNEYPDEVGFDENANSVEEAWSQTISMPISQLEDESEEVIHKPEIHALSPFHTLLAVWEDQHHISRQAHTQLVEVFQLAKSLAEIQCTTPRKDTLKSRLVKSLPLRKLHKMNVKLDRTRLPSRTKLEQDMLVFDLPDTVKTLLSSPDIVRDIHRGMAHFTDGPVNNPWEARWWGESIRSTSGQFFRYPDGSPIFPSDFIRYKCITANCPVAGFQCEKGHIGRITYCGVDFTEQAKESQTTGTPIILVQKVFERRDLPPALRSLSGAMGVSQSTQGCVELVLVEDERFILHPNSIIHQVQPVTIDYYYDPSDPSVRPAPLLSAYAVRYAFNSCRREFRVMKLTSPHRGELELKVYGRDHFIRNFASRKVISLPFQVFVDAFGLYYNMYRSIMGVYLIGEFFNTGRRLRKHSILPLTLGPFGAEIADVFKALFHIRELDAGREVEVNGEKFFICSYIHCIIGDMPQQQELSGCLSHAAKLPCRFCIIEKDKRDDLNFNIIQQGRYHTHLQGSINDVHSLQYVTAQRNASTELGIHLDKDLMKNLYSLLPALDIIRTRPVDAAHSECQGLSRMLHGFLLKDILTGAASTEICSVYQTFSIPPGWPRFQSPKKHLDSWRIMDYLHGAVVLPVLLRCWLKDSHIKKECQSLIVLFAKDYLDITGYEITGLGVRVAAFTPADWIVVACRTFAQSIIAIFGKSAKPHTDIMQKIIAGRKVIQFFCKVLATDGEIKLARKESEKDNEAKGTKRKAKKGAAQQKQGSYNNTFPAELLPNPLQRDSPPPSSVASTPTQTSRKKKADPRAKIIQYTNWMALPNIHTGLHIPDVIEQYGSCNLMSTLPGEKKHAEYKLEIATTNHRDAAATLINRENIKQTLHYLFCGSYESVTPDLHAIFQLARLTCPTLTRAIDPPSEYRDDEDDHDDSSLAIMSDSTHKAPLAIHRVNSKIVKSQIDPYLRVEVVRNSMGNDDFVTELRKAFSRDYNQYLGVLDRNILQWSKKFAFTEPKSRKRICFSAGDFVKISEVDRRDFTFARVDGIFVYQRTSSNWLFLVVTFAAFRTSPPYSDHLLKHALYTMTDRRAIIGLPRVSSEQVWMVQGANDSLLFVDHDVWTM